MKVLRILAMIAAVALMAAAFRWPPGSRAAGEQPAERNGRAHRHAVSGSHRHQFGYPAGTNGYRAPAYNPTPPPAAPAPNGVREFELVIEEDVPHEIAPGVTVPAWTFNRTVPGPVLRATEGDLVRVKVINKGKTPHTIHFHGMHPASMDGVFELIEAGGTFTYEFIAKPFGIMPYHCHAMPNSQHIQNGLYGMLIIDPKQGRKPMRELAMVMSAFDLDRDGEAEFYAWNGRAFQYADHPIELRQGEPVRMYVMNMFEERMVPHLHANMYQLYPTGTSLKPTEYTDVKTLNIAERAILEFQYDHPGTFMFQCHVTEHMEQGLMGWFKVAPPGEKAAARQHAHSGSSP